ncbi:MAG TPA: energy-coupling factor transporter transmembrane component T [Nitrososphaerales archaeon]|nr:energy-coupling factor transporter transmembrane component T [Nitrososphaerales archaeon]
MSLSWYVAKESFLHRASSLSKLAFVVFLWITTFVFVSPFWNAIELVFVLGVLFLARIPLSSLVAYLKVIFPVLAAFLIIFPLVDHGGTVFFEYGPIQISWVGISAGIIAASRIGTLFFATVGVLLSTTRERDLILGLMKGGLPYGASFLLMLTLRFISLSMADLTIIREARRARALPERENPIQLVRNLISIVIPLFLATIRRIQTSSNALEVKGFTPGAGRTMMTEEKVGKTEIAWGIFFVALTVLIVILRLRFGFFTA